MTSDGHLINEFGQPIGRPVDLDRSVAAPPHTAMRGRYCDVVPLEAHEHGAALHTAFTDVDDDAEWTYLPYGPFVDAGALAAWLRSVQDGPDPAFYTIIDETGVCSGVASHLRIDPRSASVEVGHIHLARRLRQTAAATEAMYLMMQRAFDGGYRRYEWKCDDLNAPSRAAATRLGFTYEGTFRQATHYKGRNRDTAWYSILDSEWPALRTEFERWLDPGNFDDAGRQRTALRTRRADDVS